jgi:hypothetical protein
MRVKKLRFQEKTIVSDKFELDNKQKDWITERGT